MSHNTDLTDSFMQFLQDPDKRFYRLQGSAGRGKSYSIKQLIKALTKLRQVESMLDPEKKIVTKSNLFVTATTNQATAVLFEDIQQLEKELNVNIYLSTVYSFFGLRVIDDYKTGDKHLVKANNAVVPEMKQHSLLVIDEASYVQKRIWREIQDMVDCNTTVKVLLVADARQGRVINEGLSKCITEVPQDFELDKSFRFPEDSAINLNSKHLEKVIDGTAEPIPFLEDETFEIITRKQSTKLMHQALVQDSLDLKYVGYYNKTINRVNGKIQMAKYGDTRFHAGQELLSPDTQIVKDILIPNNAKVTVVKTGVETTCKVEDKLGESVSVKTYEITVTVGKSKELTFNVPRDLPKYYTQLNKLRKNKQWFLFFEIKKLVLELRPSWAITCFKSQGSSYDYTVVDFAELEAIASTEDFYRMLNVAITRSRKKTYLIMED